MGVLRVDHPDIIDFITAKQEEGALHNFNLWVAVTDGFMEAAQGRQPYDLIHPGTGRVTMRLDAAKVLQAIAEAAWASGDPGVLFLDAIERANPTPHLLMASVSHEALAASQHLAEERGVFPAWPDSTYARLNIRVRNATRTAMAPTVTIGIIAGTSASIEPLFALAYRRTHVLGDEALPEVNPLLVEHLARHGLPVDETIKKVGATGTLREVDGISNELKHLFVTALDIPPERHLQIQAAFQRHVDNSVSRTVNLAQSATIEDVAYVYRRAWELGLKGVTIYRYGSKSTQVLELGAGEEPFHYDHASKCDPGECRV
jgi:ribonucleotide reductase alpha subunit